MKGRNKIIPIGYWFDPKDVEDTITHPKAELYIMFNLHDRVKRRLILFLKTFGRKIRDIHYKGSSNCRLCGERLGSGEEIREWEGKKYCIPHQFEHYINEHDILIPLPEPLQSHYLTSMRGL